MAEVKTTKAIALARALLALAVVALAASMVTGLGRSQAYAADGADMFRLYNPNSGEHHYTASATERDGLVDVGWADEGVAWAAPESGVPVYRLYNSYEPLGDHHYTTDKDEYDLLVAQGWTGEDVGWYSDEAQGVGMYRLYNPNAYSLGMSGAHHYTADKDEADSLVALGWTLEGSGAWYGIDKDKADSKTGGSTDSKADEGKADDSAKEGSKADEAAGGSEKSGSSASAGDSKSDAKSDSKSDSKSDASDDKGGSDHAKDADKAGSGNAKDADNEGSGDKDSGSKPDDPKTDEGKTDFAQYTVQFVGEDGKTVISSAKYDKGTKAADVKKPADPIKAADADNTYVFAGWTPAIADVMADATYKATFTAVPKNDTKTDDGVTAAGGIFENKPEGAASIELKVEAAADVPTADKVETTYGSETKTAIGTNEIAGVYDVDLIQHNTDGSTKEITEGVGNMTLTFPVDGVENGTSAKVIQLHETASGTSEVISHETTVSDNKVTVTLNDKLSTFIVTVAKAAPAVTKYTVTVASGIENGTVTADKAEAASGDAVALTVTPATNYELDTLTVTDSNNQAVTVTDGKFTMPASNVTVSATFTATASAPALSVELAAGTHQGQGKTSFAIKANSDDSKTLYAQVQNMSKGDTSIFTQGWSAYAVGLSASDFENFKVKWYKDSVSESNYLGESSETLWNSSSNSLGTNTDFTFTPASLRTANAGTYKFYAVAEWSVDGYTSTTSEPLEFTVTAVEAKTITIKDGITGGVIATEPSGSALPGEEVTLTVTPEAGKELDMLSVKDAENKDVSITNNKFTMPDGNVTVSATFKDSSTSSGASVTFHLNGGTWNDWATGDGMVTKGGTKNITNSSDATITITGSGSLTLNYLPSVGEENEISEREGYELEGWYSDSSLTTKVNAGTTFSESANLYAKWKETPAERINLTITDIPEGYTLKAYDENGNELTADSYSTATAKYFVASNNVGGVLKSNGTFSVSLSKEGCVTDIRTYKTTGRDSVNLSYGGMDLSPEPVAVEGLVCNGTEQVGTAKGWRYTLAVKNDVDDNKLTDNQIKTDEYGEETWLVGTNAGTYTAVATLVADGIASDPIEVNNSGCAQTSRRSTWYDGTTDPKMVFFTIVAAN